MSNRYNYACTAVGECDVYFACPVTKKDAEDFCKLFEQEYGCSTRYVRFDSRWGSEEHRKYLIAFLDKYASTPVFQNRSRYADMGTQHWLEEIRTWYYRKESKNFSSQKLWAAS